MRHFRNSRSTGIFAEFAEFAAFSKFALAAMLVMLFAGGAFAGELNDSASWDGTGDGDGISWTDGRNWLDTDSQPFDAENYPSGNDAVVTFRGSPKVSQNGGVDGNVTVLGIINEAGSMTSLDIEEGKNLKLDNDNAFISFGETGEEANLTISGDGTLFLYDYLSIDVRADCKLQIKSKLNTNDSPIITKEGGGTFELKPREVNSREYRFDVREGTMDTTQVFTSADVAEGAILSVDIKLSGNTLPRDAKEITLTGDGAFTGTVDITSGYTFTSGMPLSIPSEVLINGNGHLNADVTVDGRWEAANTIAGTVTVTEDGVFRPKARIPEADVKADDGATIEAQLAEANMEEATPALSFKSLEAAGTAKEFTLHITGLFINDIPAEGVKCFLVEAADGFKGVDLDNITFIAPGSKEDQDRYSFEIVGNILYAMIKGDDDDDDKNLDEIIEETVDPGERDKLQNGRNIIVDGKVLDEDSIAKGFPSGITVELLFLQKIGDLWTPHPDYEGRPVAGLLFESFIEGDEMPEDEPISYAQTETIKNGHARLVFEAPDNEPARAAGVFKAADYTVFAEGLDNLEPEIGVKAKIRVSGGGGDDGGYPRSGSSGCDAGFGVFAGFALLTMFGAAALRRKG